MDFDAWNVPAEDDVFQLSRGAAEADDAPQVFGPPLLGGGGPLHEQHHQQQHQQPFDLFGAAAGAPPAAAGPATHLPPAAEVLLVPRPPREDAPPVPARAAAAAAAPASPPAVEDGDSEEVRKAKQRVLDRARRKRMNQSMEELTALVRQRGGASAVPAAKRAKMDKAAVLEQSVDLVARLQRENEELRAALQRDQLRLAQYSAGMAPSRADRMLDALRLAVSSLGGSIREQDVPYEVPRRSRAISRAFGGAPTIVVIKDMRQNVISVNEAFSMVSGWRPEEVIGCSMPVVFATQLRPGLPPRVKSRCIAMVHKAFSTMVEDCQTLLAGEQTVTSRVMTLPRPHPVTMERGAADDPCCGTSLARMEGDGDAAWLELAELVNMHWMIRDAAGQPKYFVCMSVPTRRVAEVEVGLGVELALPNLTHMARSQGEPGADARAGGPEDFGQRIRGTPLSELAGASSPSRSDTSLSSPVQVLSSGASA